MRSESESFRVTADEEGEEKEEDVENEDGGGASIEAGPAEGASYWVSLLGSYAGKLRDADQEDPTKSLRKRHRTERAAAAIAGNLP